MWKWDACSKAFHDGPGCESIHHFPNTPAQSELQSKNCEYSQYQNIHFAQACRGNDVCSHSPGHRAWSTHSQLSLELGAGGNSNM